MEIGQDHVHGQFVSHVTLVLHELGQRVPLVDCQSEEDEAREKPGSGEERGAELGSPGCGEKPLQAVTQTLNGGGDVEHQLPTNEDRWDGSQSP